MREGREKKGYEVMEKESGNGTRRKEKKGKKWREKKLDK